MVWSMTSAATDWSAIAERVAGVRRVAGDFAAAAKMHFRGRLKDIRLFGSAARGDWREGSDVDVLLLLDDVTPQDRDWIAEEATRKGILGRGVLISTVTLSVSRYEFLRRRERLFVREIDEQGMPL